MPRLPQYQPGQIAPVQATQARFRAPDNPGGLGLLAEALAGGAKVLNTADKINIENEETQTRQEVANARVQYAGRYDQYKDMRLGAARTGQDDFNKGIDKITSDALAKASNPRMRRMMEQELLPLQADYRRMGDGHVLDQGRLESDASFKVEQQALIETAAGSDNPAFRDRQGLSLRDSVRRELQFQGYDEKATPQAFAMAEKEALTRLHAGVVNKMFSVTDPHLDEIGEYYLAYGDEMTNELKTAILQRLQGPLQDRAGKADAGAILAIYRGAAQASNAAKTPAVGAMPVDLDAITEHSESAKQRYAPGGGLLTSPAGAMGEMQVMPDTARDPGFGIRPWNGKDPDDLARVGREFRAKMEKRYGGDLSKMWAAYNWGPGNLDQAIKAYGTDWLSHAPSETRAYVAKNVAAAGGLTVPANAPQEYDHTRLSQSIDQWAQQTGASPERVARARQALNGHVATDEGLLNSQRQQAEEAMNDIIAQAGDGFRVSMLPDPLIKALSPVQLKTAKDIETRLKAPKQVEANGDEYLRLSRIAQQFPEQFGQLNLGQFVGKVTPGELRQLSDDQGRIIRNGPGETDLRGAIEGTITSFVPFTISKPDRIRVHDSMSSYLRAITLGKRPPTSAELRDALNASIRTITVERPGRIWGTNTSEKRAFNLGIEDVPERERNLARGALRRAGQEETDDAVVSLYLQKLARQQALGQ